MSEKCWFWYGLKIQHFAHFLDVLMLNILLFQLICMICSSLQAELAAPGSGILLH